MPPSTTDRPASVDLNAWYKEYRGRSIFEHLSNESSVKLLRGAKSVSFEAQEVIRRPETPQQLFLVAEGEVGLYAGGSRRIRQAIVSPGRALELKAILGLQPRWDHTWIAETNTRLFVIERSALEDALLLEPEAEAYLKTVALYPELRTVKNDLRLFGMDLADVKASLARFASCDAKVLTGTKTREKCLVVVHRGELLVTAKVRFVEQEVGRISAGEYFMLDGSTELTISALPETSIWVLTHRAWATVIGQAKVATVSTLFQPLESKIVSPSAGTASHAVAGAPNSLEEDEGPSVADFEVTPKEQRKLHRRKFPVAKQHDQMDCGAACLAAVASFHGRKISLPAFRSLVHVTREGASMLAVKRAAETVGFEAIGICAGYNGLKKLRTPFIGLMQYHFIVVYKVTDTEVVAGDPAKGLVTIPVETFKKEFSLNALLLRATPKLKKYPESASSFGKYLSLLKDQKVQFAEVFLASLLVTVFGLLTPLFMQVVFDHVLSGGKSGMLTAAALGVIFLHLLSGGLEWVRNYLLTHHTSRLDTKFSAQFLRHTFSLPLNFFAVRRVGDITTRLGEIEKVRDFFTGRTVNVVIRAMSAALYCAVIALYSLKLLALLAILLPFVAAVIGLLLPRLLRNLRETYSALAKNQGLTFEQFNSLDTIKSINGQVAARWRWEATLLRTLDLRKALERLNAIAAGASEALRGLISVSMLLAAVLLYLRQELTLGQVVAINSLVGSVVRPLIEVICEWNEFSQVGISLARIDDVITSAVEPEPADKKRVDHRVSGDIEFVDVTFQYGSELSPIVLDGVSLTVKRGETVAFVGPSGSGKTTLGYMINRLYAPNRGKVLLDGVDATEIPIATLRSQVAMVLQENHLFSGTILENITLGDARPSFERAMEAATAADAHEFIARLPQGYATLLAEGGGNLSGGQKQRINIARALYRDPAVLIMDEATAALDAISEEAIVKNMAAASKGRTTFIIAHRLNTIMHADRIVVLKRGKIIESGKHKELFDKRGYYFQLCKNQLGV